VDECKPLSVGDVRLNGEVMTQAIFTKYCAMVPQQDKHWAGSPTRPLLGLT